MAREHTHSTEALIIISQTFFLVFLFVFLKKTLVDNRKMMANRRLMKKNALQLVAIFFSIIVLLGLLTIPLWHYKYAEIVMIFVLAAIAAILGHDIKRIMEGQGVSDPPEEEDECDDESDVESPAEEIKEEKIRPPPPPARELVRVKRAQPNENGVKKTKSLFSFTDTVKSAFGPSKPSVQKHVCSPSHGLNF